MPRWRLLVLVALPLLVGAASCAAPDPRPGPVRAAAPRTGPPARPVAATHPAPADVPDLRARLRRGRWAARFWEELTPVQRRRVAERMRGAAPAAAADLAGRWNVMGLEDRARLVFGSGQVRPCCPVSGPGRRPTAHAG